MQMMAAGAAVFLTSVLALGTVDAQPAPPAPAVADAAPPGTLAQAEPAAPEPELNPRHVNCVAKVVHHEAANQSRAGQIAVAQVLINRVKEGFGPDVCAVARQPGQFFRLNRYHPNRKSETWAEAVDVARTVLAGEVRDRTRGALYFHANWAKPDRFFRTRTRMARVEDHDFYR